MADRQIDELSFATDISDATTFAANNNAATYEAQQVSVGQIATFMGARADAVHNLGDLHYNKSNLAIDNPGAVPGWTGEYVTNANNVYPDLYTWLKTSHPELCITRSAYDAAITADGECRYFVVDEESGSIRFPKYTYTAPDYPWIYCFNAAVPQTTTQGAEYTTSLISKVSKAGDTMTGPLTLQGTNPSQIIQKSTRIDITSTPNQDQYDTYLDKVDKNGKVFGRVFGTKDLNGFAGIALQAFNSKGNNAVISVKIDENGTVIVTSPTPPSNANNLQIANTAWVRNLLNGQSGRGFDAVIETFSDANGNWYRVYKSGWVEQGGTINVPATTTEYNFLKPYASNVKVTLVCSRYTLNFSTAMTNARIYAVAGTPCIKFGITNGSNTTEGMFWRAEGQGAN